jgi:hypothetical protein
MNPKLKISLGRVLVGVVLIWNLQAAAAFIINPGGHAPGFELIGIPGEAAIRGFGVLFLMWNVPYAVALWHPLRYRISLYEALAMQIIGVVGETLIYLSVPAIYATSRLSLGRFIFFDALGVLFLIAAAWLVRSLTRPVENQLST